VSEVTGQDPFDLERFVAAQDQDGTYNYALAELQGGRKSTHWMWFVFPQLAGLGQSTMSRKYAIRSLDEARAYLGHIVLGTRLVECASVLAGTQGRTAEEIFGVIDAFKLQSSMTLFIRATPERDVFQHVLSQYYRGAPDPATDHLLARLGIQGR